MRKFSLVVVMLGLLAATVPLHAGTRSSKVVSWAKAFLVWTQGKVSPPLPSPAPSELPAANETNRTTS